MDSILEWGYDLIRWIQGMSPALDTLFKAITTLGSEQGFLLVLPLAFWCWDKRRGVRLGLLLLLSAYLNGVLKDLLDQPRPSPARVKVLATETNSGLPSGHAQNSMVVFGYLAAQVRRPRTWILAGLVIFGVGLSRIYLGVHFPSDVVGGWLVGAGLLALYLWLEPELERNVRSWSWGYKMLLAIAFPLALLLGHANENSARALGIVLGFMAGWLMELRWVGFSTKGSLAQRALRFVVGGVVLIAVWLSSRALLPSEPETTAVVFRLLRYILVGVWASLGAPWLFVRLGLASRESDVWMVR